jgi:hypothetical protein
MTIDKLAATVDLTVTKKTTITTKTVTVPFNGQKMQALDNLESKKTFIYSEVGSIQNAVRFPESPAQLTKSWTINHSFCTHFAVLLNLNDYSILLGQLELNSWESSTVFSSPQ